MSKRKRNDDGKLVNENGFPLGRFHRWRMDGGTLSSSPARRKKSPALFPFLLSGEQTGESEGAKGYVFSALLLMVGLVVGWAYWFNASFFGNDGPNMFELTATARALDRGDRVLALQASPEPTLIQPTSFQISVNASPVPTATLTATPGQFRPQVKPTHTPGPPTHPPRPVVEAAVSPAPTVSGYLVTVQVSSYWPDDGPDWCRDWNTTASRCDSYTTLGLDWRLSDNATLAACAAEWLGKRVVIPALSLSLRCVDTGVSFGCVGGSCTVGVLSSHGGFSGQVEAVLYD